MSLLSNFLGGIGKLTASIYNLGATIANGIISPINTGIKALTSFNQTAIDTAKNVGMPFQQSIAYTRVLISDTQKLAMAYGVTKDQIAALQNVMTQATGRAVLLNQSQKEGLLQTQKFIDTNSQGKIISSIDEMGGSVNVANTEMLKLVSNASKYGIAVSKASSDFASNLSLVNKYTFANGIDGISKMTLLSEKLRVDLSSIMQAADKFSSGFSTSIEASAKLQNLGGLGAAYGANPLTLMYEGLEDPESLMERISKIFESMAVFDTKTGTGRITGQNRQILNAQADALGITHEDAAKMAMNGARNKYIEGQMGAKYDQLTEDQQAFLTNKAQWNDKTQRFELNTVNERTGQMEVHDINELTPRQIEQYQKEAAMTTTDAVKNASRQLVSMDERAKAYQSLVQAMLADIFWPILGDMYKLQTQTFALFGSVGKLIADTITQSGWWKIIAIDGIATGAKLLYMLSLKHPIMLGINTIAEGIFQVTALLSKGKIIGPNRPFMALEAVNGMIDMARDAIVDGLGLSKLDAEVQQDKDEVKQQASVAWSTLTNMGSKVFNELSKNVGQISKTYKDAVNSFGQTGDVVSNKATSAVSNKPFNSNVNTAYIVPQSSTYYAQPINQGNVRYTEVESGYSPQPIYNDVVNINGQEQSGNVVKGGEVTNGVTPVHYETTNNTSMNHSMSIEPLKVDVSGTIRLEGANGGLASIDAEQLLHNKPFVSMITEKVQKQFFQETIHTSPQPINFRNPYVMNVINTGGH